MIKKRRAAVVETIERVKRILDNNVTVSSLNAAKAVLMELAAQATLFPDTDFPVPSEEDIERTDLIHEERDGSFALYVNSSRPGQKSRPHDHGGAWAMVAAISGEEEHRVFVRDDAKGADESAIVESGIVIVKPGTAISMLAEGIHAIHAVSDEPLKHLHLYGNSFRLQGERKEYDLEQGTVRKFVLEDLGFIEDRR